MVKEIAKYETSATNAEIAASGSAHFFTSDSDKQAQLKHNSSFNNLEIVNDSSLDLFIDMDGLNTRRRTLFAKSAIVIKAEQGIFFNNVKVTNKSTTTALAASSLAMVARIVEVV